MELHSPIYLLFLLPAVSVTAFTRRPTGRLLLFLALSYCFYLSWSPVFILLLVGSSLVNFLMGRLLYRNRRSWVLCFGIVVNILILLLARNAGAFLTSLFGPASIPGVLLPVGVSFYTFQALGCLIDIYRGFDKKATLLEFLVFMAFWPVVLSGPICRLPEMLPQFRKPTSAWNHGSEGIQRIVLGLFMKVVLADSLAQGVYNQGGVNWGFDQVQTWNPMDIVSLSLGYGLQLFFDFAGYSHHCDRVRPAGWNTPQGELQVSLWGDLSKRLLGPLAHVSLVLDPRLRLLSPGDPTKEPWMASSCRHCRHGGLWSLARSGSHFSALGPLSRTGFGRSEDAQQELSELDPASSCSGMGPDFHPHQLGMDSLPIRESGTGRENVCRSVFNRAARESGCRFSPSGHRAF